MKHLSRTALIAALIGGGMFRAEAEAQTSTATPSNPATGDAANAPTPAPSPTPAPVVIPAGMKGEQFHFRKEKIKDDTGKVIGEGKKHPSITVPLPIPTKEQLLEIFTAASEGEGNRAAEQKYILDLIADAFYEQARDQINDYRSEEANKDKIVDANVLDYSKINILALATMPASERGSKFSEDDMKQFLEDYAAVMPAAVNKDATKIKAQVGLLERQLRPVKTDKKVLGVMKDMLTMWAASTAALEDHQPIYDWFLARIEKWSKEEPKNVLASIM